MENIKYPIIAGTCLSAIFLLGAKHVDDSTFSFKNIYTDPNNSNRIVYISDNEGNRVPDFSYAGYKNSNVELPNISSNILEVNCQATDCTQAIQDAIDTVANYPLQSDGFRGVVSLPAGTYNISSGLRINASGVILRGAGIDSTSLKVVGNNNAATEVLTLGSSTATGAWDNTSGTQAFIDNVFVPVGATEFRVQSGGYTPNVGDEIIVLHPKTTTWIAQVNYGGVPSPGWLNEPNLPDIKYKRTVKNVIQSGANYLVAIDAPLMNRIEKAVTPAYIYKFDAQAQGYTNNVGIENLTIDIGSADNVTAYIGSGVIFRQTSDSWAKNVRIKGYNFNGFNTNTADRITINNSEVINPIGPLDGGYRYAFRTSSTSNNVLCDGCSAEGARHPFIPNFFNSGSVYVRSKATNNYGPGEGHQKWAHGNLFDKIELSGSNDAASFANRGTSGTNHGWSGAHSVMWGVNANPLNVQPASIITIEKPPTAQNYCYNCVAGTVTGVGLYGNLFQGSPGYFENNGQTLPSLFDTQLAERKATSVNPPSAPANLKTSVSGASVTLSWDNLALDATNIIVERSTNAGASFTQLATLSATSTSYVDNTGSSANAPGYQYRVYARKNISNGVLRSATSNTSPVVARYVKIAIEAPMTTTNTVRINEIGVYSNSTTNVSYKKTVTATPGTSNEKALTDGRTSSYWQASVPQPGASAAAPIFASINLNGVHRIKQIKLFQGTSFYPVEYYLYVSPDAVNWTQIQGVVTATGGNVTFDF